MDIDIILSLSFEKWLKTLGYAQSTVYVSGRYVQDFFFYLKSQNVIQLEEIQPHVIQNYYAYLQIRSHKKHAGGLSINYIASNINALKRFSRYLQETGRPFLDVPIKTTPDKTSTKIILTRQEITSLYKACGSDVLGLRDRAMLSVYYGCGLRRSEGVALNRKDVQLKEKLVFVRGAKGYKPRYVPMTDAIKEDLENYIYSARSNSLEGCGSRQEAFFVSYRATRMCGNAMLTRLHTLTGCAGINKSVGLHTLRHSIATHLLQSGLSLEEVSQFLGHSSLESTQIYTHIQHETY